MCGGRARVTCNTAQHSCQFESTASGLRLCTTGVSPGSCAGLCYKWPVCYQPRLSNAPLRSCVLFAAQLPVQPCTTSVTIPAEVCRPGCWRYCSTCGNPWEHRDLLRLLLRVSTPALARVSVDVLAACDGPPQGSTDGFTWPLECFGSAVREAGGTCTGTCNENYGPDCTPPLAICLADGSWNTVVGGCKPSECVRQQWQRQDEVVWSARAAAVLVQNSL